MKRIPGIVLILIVLAAFTPLGCFAASLTCSNFQQISINAECTVTQSEEGNSFNLDGEFTLDLNGNSLTAQAITCATEKSCSLTISDTKNTGVLTSGIFLGNNGDLIIESGTVEASGEREAISGRIITINDGTVTTTLSQPKGTSIRGSSIIINGGKVTAIVGDNGIHADGDITINGGEVNATGNIYGIQGSRVAISKGMVTATAKGYKGIGIEGRSIVDISGGQVMATATGSGGIGIESLSGTVDISGGTVTATIADNGANGISGKKGVRISSATVTTEGGGPLLAGIFATGGGITISSGTVTTNGSGVLGIYAMGGDVTISGGTVTSDSRIDTENQGTITISGGQVTASSIGFFTNSIKLGWDKPTDFIHAGTYRASSGTIEALKPFSAFATKEKTGDPAPIAKGTVEDTNTINDKWLYPPHFTITWKNDDGSVIGTTSVAVGETPAHEDPFKPDTEQYTYTFDHWEPEPVPAAADAAYTAVFTKTRLFTITWKNDDGSVIDTTKAAEGKTPAHADPSKPDTEQYLYTFERWDPEPVPADGDATYTAVFKATERKPNLLPVYFTHVRQDGAHDAPDDIKEQTWNLSFTLSLNGNSYASVKADPLKILPGGNHQSILVTFGNDLDVSQLNSDYKVDVKGVPSGVSADIYSADGGPVKQYTVSAGDPRFGNETETNAVRLTILVQWGWKEVSVKGPEPEVIRVVALPEDEIGAFQLRADGTKEYLIFQTYDICMAYLGRDELCRGPERCYHK